MRQLSSVGELKKNLDPKLDKTELVAETESAMTKLCVGIANRVRNRYFLNKEILIFGENRIE